MVDKQNKCIIPLVQGSVTYAMKVQRMLTARSIYAEVARADSHAQPQGGHGCGYGVTVYCRDRDAAERIIKAAGLRIADGR